MKGKLSLNGYPLFAGHHDKHSVGLKNLNTYEG